MSYEQYEAADGCSCSMLNLLAERSPAHLKAWMDGYRHAETDAQRMGIWFHRAIFEPDTMKDAFHVKPEGMNFTTKDGRAWKEAHQDRPILSTAEYNEIESVSRSVNQHPVAGRMLKNARFEASCFVEDSHGTLRKFRPDILPNAGSVIPDLKTVKSAAPEDFSKAIFQYQWFKKAAYYLDGAKLLGRDFDAFAFIAVEKENPYCCAVYQLDPQAVDIGRMFYQRDLAVYRQCLETGKWPGYELGAPIISLPEWFTKQIERVA